MPKYVLHKRSYKWPHYALSGAGGLRYESFESENDEQAIKRVVESREFQAFRGHKYHQDHEQDYYADFVLTRVIDLPKPPRLD